MQIKKTLAASALAGSAMAAYVPSEPWTTLTPSATYSGGDVWVAVFISV